jgi:hypothetical protein
MKRVEIADAAAEHARAKRDSVEELDAARKCFQKIAELGDWKSTTLQRPSNK